LGAYHVYSARSAGISFGNAFAVVNPETTAPWEYPPRTILVFGQFAAVAWTCVAAS
jgi:hypothetical protein